jgi:tetratricopeptide (TPR) repeat protein
MKTRSSNLVAEARFTSLFGFLLMLALICVALWFNPALATGAEPVPQPVVTALLAEDWERLAGPLLADVNVSTDSPILRMIKGHVCLAMNRNNESLCLFRSAASPADLSDWHKYTEALLAKHSKNPVIAYLNADAMARLGDWKSAEERFSNSLSGGGPRLKAMALNSRGVALAELKRFGDAIMCIHNATLTFPSFADAHANSGFLALLLKESVKSALEDFTAAVHHSPNFSLAQYGMGFTAGILGRFEIAEKAFDSSLSQPGCAAEYMSALVQSALQNLSDRNAALIAQDEGDNPGMSVSNAITAMNNDDLGFRGSGYMAGYRAALQLGGKSLDEFNRSTAAYMHRNPDHTKYIANYRQNVGDGFALISMLSKYQIGVGTNVGFNLNPASNKTGAGAGLQVSTNQSLTLDLRPASRSATLSLGRYKQSEMDLRQMAPAYQTKSQGFDSAPSKAGIDEGNWPFKAIFGLAFPNSTL